MKTETGFSENWLIALPHQRDLWGLSTIRSFLLPWRQITPPEQLFHYTSAEAFQKIVESGKIWLTNASYLNDQNELSYPTTVCRDVLQEMLEEKTETTPVRFLEQVAHDLHAHEILKSWYVGSLSTEGNLLSQWRAYCPGGGYSMGFNGPELLKITNAQTPARLGQVCYDADEQRRQIREVIEQHIVLRDKVRKEHPEVGEEEYERAAAHTLDFALAEVFVFFKTPSFREEHEWRLTWYELSNALDKIRFRVRSGILTPYIEINLKGEEDKMPLQQVYIGPLGEFDLASHSASMLLAANRYPKNLIERAGYRLRF